MNIITINNNVMQKNIYTRSKKKVYIKKKQKKKTYSTFTNSLSKVQMKRNDFTDFFLFHYLK